MLRCFMVSFGLCLALSLWWMGPGCAPTTTGPGDGSTLGDGGGTKDGTLVDVAKEPVLPDATGPKDSQEPSAERPGPEPSPELAAEPSPEPTAEPTVEATADGGVAEVPAETVADATATGMIQIYLKGDLTKQTYQDSYGGQTPTDYQIALSRYEVLTRLDDPNPQPCFDHGKTPKIADMSKDNLMGACLSKSIKSGNYTHGRVKVDWAQYTVDGTLHFNGAPLPGKFTFFRAYSDTEYMGKTYKASEGFIRYVGVTTVENPYTFPASQSFPGITTKLVNGEYFMTFPYKRALPVLQTNPQGHWARFHWKIFEAFRWEEKTLTGYTKDTWDVDADTTKAEEVKLFGVSDYFITTSID